MRPPVRLVARPALVALLLVLAPVRATGTNTGIDPRSFVPDPGLFLPVGIVVGGGTAATGEDGRFLFGVEASLVYSDLGDTWVWAGGYADFTWEPGRLLASVGPEFGWGPIGIDGGYVVGQADDEARHGLAVRLLLTFGPTALFARYTGLFGAEDGLAFGVLIKYPFRLD